MMHCTNRCLQHAIVTVFVMKRQREDSPVCALTDGQVGERVVIVDEDGACTRNQADEGCAGDAGHDSGLERGQDEERVLAPLSVPIVTEPGFHASTRRILVNIEADTTDPAAARGRFWRARLYEPNCLYQLAVDYDSRRRCESTPAGQANDVKQSVHATLCARFVAMMASVEGSGEAAALKHIREDLVVASIYTQPDDEYGQVTICGAVDGADGAYFTAAVDVKDEKLHAPLVLAEFFDEHAGVGADAHGMAYNVPITADVCAVITITRRFSF